MKRLSVFAAVIFTILIFCNTAFCADKGTDKGAAPKQKSAGGNAATVNGVAITKEEFDREFTLIKRQLESMGNNIDSAKLSAFKENVLDNLIGAELLFQESTKEGIKVDNAQVELQIKQMSSRFKTDEEFTAALKGVGLTKAIVTAQVKRGLAIKLLIDKLYTNKITATDKETKDFYDQNPNYFKRPEQVKASHILIKTDTGDDEKKKAEKKKKLEDIETRLKKGEDFATLAKEYSDDPSGKAQGGDLGYFGKGQMVKPFEDAAFSMKAGDISPIVETQFGYHIIKVTDKRAASTVPLEEVKDRIKEQLIRNKIRAEVTSLIGKLKEKAKIKKMS